LCASPFPPRSFYPPLLPLPFPQIDRNISREIDAARAALAPPDPPRALLALRRKRLQEDAADRLDAHLLTIEQVLTHLEDASAAAAVVAALKTGNAALAAARAALPLSDVEAVLKDAAAAASYERAMSGLLAEGGGLGEEGEAAVAGELEAMESEAAAAEAGALPAAPTTRVDSVVEEAPRREGKEAVEEEGGREAVLA